MNYIYWTLGCAAAWFALLFLGPYYHFMPKGWFIAGIAMFIVAAVLNLTDKSAILNPGMKVRLFIILPLLALATIFIATSNQGVIK